jgi:hypothetical protein
MVLFENVFFGVWAGPPEMEKVDQIRAIINKLETGGGDKADHRRLVSSRKIAHAKDMPARL